MKRWYLLTLALYLLLLLLLAAPVGWLASWPDYSFPDVVHSFLEWPVGFWLAVWAAVFVGGAALLLLVPVGSAQRRPKPRRKLLVPVVASTFFMALLALSAGLCIVLAIWGDHADQPFGTFFTGDNGAARFVISLCVMTALAWLFWAWLFHRYRRSLDPDLLTNRLTRWLLAGSITIASQP